jgi:hypothetical protein
VAVDNEQYRLWVASRWRVELEGGEGFRAIHRLLGSAVEYRRRDAFALDGLEERFDFVCWSAFCIGSRIHSGCCACCVGRTGGWRHGAGRDLRRRPGRSKGPGDPRLRARGGLRARRVRLMGVRGRRPAADRPDSRLLARRVARQCGGRRRPAHHRSAGRVEAPGRRSQQPLHKTTIIGRYCRSGFVELSGSSSAPIRAPSDWRFGAARLLSC